MTTIYKAIPEETEINITYLNESLRFIGNDAEIINIDDVQYGHTLIIDEASSLKEINIKKPGATISFSSFPKQTVRIKGAFEEVRIQDKKDHYALHRFGSNPTLPLDTLWGAIVTNDHEVDCAGIDDLIMKTQGISDLEVKDDLSHISIIGDKSLNSIKVTGKRIIRSFTVHQGPALQSLNIQRRVLTCSLKRCPFIDTIIGFGDRLDLQPKPRKKNTLSIGGFWHQVPEWYDLQVALLQIPHFKAHLTAEEIISCADMGGVSIIPYSYDGQGGLVRFSNTLGMDIDELSFGIPITDFIQLIQDGDEAEFNLLRSWCSNNLSWFDQYKVMRILASLISNGYDSGAIIRLRNHISEMNTSMPKLIIGSVNDGNQGGKWNPLFSGDSNEWETPNNSVMPFGRVDLEIWLHTELGIEFLGMDHQTHNFQNRYMRRRHLGENGVVRNLLVATLSAANTVGRNSAAERKLTELAESLYTNPLINSDPFCCEFTVYHLTVSRVATKPIIRALIDGIMGMAAAAWKRAALIIGIVDTTNSPRARMALKRLASDKELSFEESTLISAISVSGRRAFDTGKVAKPTWPYLKSLQTQYSK